MKYEVACGIVSGAAVAPLVSIVDEAIFCNASGKATVMQSFKQSFSKLLKQPLTFLRSPQFLWIWAVYGATYSVSNSVERRLIEKGESSPATSATKFFATSATNIGMSVIKDRAFTRMFGTTIPRPLPPVSMACYAVRDAMTIAASFTLVEPLGGFVSERFGVDKKTGTLFAQICCPLLAQTLNTPFFLYGMNLYNNPASTFTQHRQFMTAEYGKTLACRIARIAPAYSIGGVLNRFLRSRCEQYRTPLPFEDPVL